MSLLEMAAPVGVGAKESVGANRGIGSAWAAEIESSSPSAARAECPHCKRRFSAAMAGRHILLCPDRYLVPRPAPRPRPLQMQHSQSAASLVSRSPPRKQANVF